MSKLSQEVEELEKKVEILQSQLDSKNGERIVTDGQLEVIFWYVAEMFYCCAIPGKARENGLEYSYQIREMFTDLSNCGGVFWGKNIQKDAFYGQWYDIMKKCYDEHNK